MLYIGPNIASLHIVYKNVFTQKLVAAILALKRPSCEAD